MQVRPLLLAGVAYPDGAEASTRAAPWSARACHRASSPRVRPSPGCVAPCARGDRGPAGSAPIWSRCRQDGRNGPALPEYGALPDDPALSAGTDWVLWRASLWAVG